MTLLDGMAATWPPERETQVGPFRLRVAPGGGNRVTCATADAEATPADIAALETAARALGQMPTVMLRDGEGALDAALQAAGWQMGEEVVLMQGPVAAIADPAPLAAFALWPPLAVQVALLAEGHIGPERLAVMQRAPQPKTALMARADDRPAGTGFAGAAGATVYLHALSVPPGLRRRGAGRAMVMAAAQWARAQGLAQVALAVTRGNLPARTLYASLGMADVGRYHYRIRP
jgi:GNAT superfamily N-acetyltransferase